MAKQSLKQSLGLDCCDESVWMDTQFGHRLAGKELRAVLTTLREHLESLYGQQLVRVVLFGSRARGQAYSGSDIDVMVVLKGPFHPGDEIERTGAFTAALSLEHDIVISRLFVSADQFHSEKSPLLMNVRREGIPI